jgi:hypothetical protein
MSRPSIPDLRVDHNEFTLEHCSVLLTRLGRTLDVIYEAGASSVADQVDTETMRDDLLSCMSANQLSLLFDTELGKGLILGIFFTRFVLPLTEEE